MKKASIAAVLVLSAVGTVGLGISEFSQLKLFVGRFHSLLIHFPIGLLLLTGGLELWAVIGKTAKWEATIRLLLPLATAAAAVAAATGYFLSQEEGYGADALFWHLRLGLIVTIAAALALIFREIPIRAPHSNPDFIKAYRGSLLLSILVMLPAGHYGGTLAHGANYLTEYLPSPLRNFLGDAEATSTAIDLEQAEIFRDLVRPTIQRECVQCHNGAKQSGDLRLDTADWLKTPGLVVGGDPEASELFERITLPLDDERHMPPRGHSPVSVANVEVVRWWISEGASPDQKIAAAKNVPLPVQLILRRQWGATEQSPQGIFALAIPEANPESLQKLSAEGFVLSRLSENQPFLQVRLPEERRFGRAESELLLEVRAQIAWLDLSGCRLSPDSYQNYSRLVHLTRLNLARTDVTDDLLSVLATLPYLETLNLHSTQISDLGLKALAASKSLRNLYLWETRVSKAAAEVLGARNPSLKINLGQKLAAVKQN